MYFWNPWRVHQFIYARNHWWMHQNDCLFNESLCLVRESCLVYQIFHFDQKRFFRWRTRLFGAFQNLNFENWTNRIKVTAKKLKLVNLWKGCFKHVYLWMLYFKYIFLKRMSFRKFSTKNPWKGYILFSFWIRSYAC